MKLSPSPACLPLPAAQQRQPINGARFKGLGNATSQIIGVIDSKRALELLVSDGLGMFLPRVLLAFFIRGWDDARETGLREFFGLLGNIFLAGAAGYVMARMLGNSVNAYNPKGIPGKAWITSKHLDAFGKIYMEEVNQATGPPHKRLDEARVKFIHRILEGLESGDRELNLEGRLTALADLDAGSRTKLLTEMRKSVPKPTKKLNDLLDKLACSDGGLNAVRPELKKAFLESGWGKLSEKGKQSLSDYYKLKTLTGSSGSVGADAAHKGTLPLDDMARRRLREAQISFLKKNHLEHYAHYQDAELEKVLKQKGFDSKKEFIKYRLELSLNDLRSDAAAFQKAVDDKALLYNLTDTINLHYQIGNATHTLPSNRAVILTELKHFLEQYADRAGESAKQEAHVRPLHDTVYRELYASTESKNPIRKLIPQEKDGLIEAAVKSRVAYTWIPLAFCLMASGAFTFYNNYLTMKKHHGKEFFPGEGSPPVSNAHKTVPAPHPFQSAYVSRSTYQNVGGFYNHPTYPTRKEGILA